MKMIIPPIIKRKLRIRVKLAVKFDFGGLLVGVGSRLETPVVGLTIEGLWEGGEEVSCFRKLMEAGKVLKVIFFSPTVATEVVNSNDNWVWATSFRALAVIVANVALPPWTG